MIDCSARWLSPVVLAVLVSISPLSAEDWNRFRGNDGQGKAAGKAITQWDSETNVAWKLDLPGTGLLIPNRFW